MKKTLLAIAPLVVIAFVVVIDRGNKEDESKQHFNASSPSAISLSVSSSSYSQSGAPTESNADDLERIKTVIWLRETAPAVYGKLNNDKARIGSSDNQTNKYIQSKPKEYSPLTTDDGIVIRPNKYARPATVEEGYKGLRLETNILGLPKLVLAQKSSCSDGIETPLDTLKRRAESGDMCVFWQYGVRGSIDAVKDIDITKDREVWKKKLKPYYDYLLKAAINGDLFAATSLGCSYIYEPFNDKVEGLTWIMIGDAMGWNQFLGGEGCTKMLLGEPEQTYIEAIDRAKFYIDFYNIKLKSF